MKKEDVLSIMREIGVEPNNVNYEYTDRLLREFSMEVIMKMVDIGNKHAFMGDKWAVADECMKVIAPSVPKDLVKRKRSLFD